MRILILYNSSQTYTQTVFEHLDSFRALSQHEWHYIDYTKILSELHNLPNYQAIFVHYTVRLPLDQINEPIAYAISQFYGIKGLFIQDEYEYTNRAKYWINKIGFNIVFTVVPTKNINTIYPLSEFPNVKFINNLTGYAPAEINLAMSAMTVLPPSKRNIVIGYRGRQLPMKYGALGLEKICIGMHVKKFCRAKKISHDIEWNERSRIYGQKWYRFLFSCRAMLGSESGSNIFDWDGNLSDKINFYKKLNPKYSDRQLYESLLKPLEVDGLMNQISPRIFEMSAACTVMILYEGSYSNILKPHIHYLPLKKDLSNLHEIATLLKDNDFIDTMALRTKNDIINSGKYSYSSFIQLVDHSINHLVDGPKKTIEPLYLPLGSSIDLTPMRGKPPIISGNTPKTLRRIAIIFHSLKNRLPISIRISIKKLIGRV